MSSSTTGSGTEQVDVPRAPISEALRLGADADDCSGLGQRRDRLRRATGGVHRALETMLEDAGCFTSVDGYRRYLSAIAPLYAALEATLDAAGVQRLVPDWPRRRKLGLIRADLHAAGGQANCHISKCPAPATAAAPWCAGDVLGALYVLEGATLGGMILARRMRDLEPARPTRGTTFGFLDPYGDERSMLWRTFLNRLETVELTRSEEEALCPRAAAIFALFVTTGNELTRERGSW